MLHQANDEKAGGRKGGKGKKETLQRKLRVAGVRELTEGIEAMGARGIGRSRDK